MKIIDVNEARGNFFKILDASPRVQVGVMTLEPGKDSGEGDMHPGDQVVYMINGKIKAKVAGEESLLSEGQALIIPPETDHRLYNEDKTEAFFLSIYSPPAY